MTLLPLFVLASFGRERLRSAAITLVAERTVGPTGWMRDGWGAVRLTLKNAGPEVRVLRWAARWEAKGKDLGGAGGGEWNATLPSAGTVVKDEVGVLPANVADAAKPEPALMVGTVTVRLADAEAALPFRIEIPEATLPEPLRTIKGGHVALALMASRYRALKNPKRALGWIDDCYAAMIDLTGEHPYGGATMTYREAPEHPWWAYAGREMVLNTKFVGRSVQDLNEGCVPFGWIHEVGHNFDETIGPWYIWNGPCAEFQANLKLDYATRDAPFKIRWRTGSPAYGRSKDERPLAPRELVDGFYGTFGDAYLADPKRTWDTMASDDIHSLFRRLVYAHGWAPIRAWYRTYRRLQDAGRKPPESPEDKAALAVAILSRETGSDLIPTFRLWRFPVTAESVARQKANYGL